MPATTLVDWKATVVSGDLWSLGQKDGTQEFSWGQTFLQTGRSLPSSYSLNIGLVGKSRLSEVDHGLLRTILEELASLLIGSSSLAKPSSSSCLAAQLVQPLLAGGTVGLSSPKLWQPLWQGKVAQLPQLNQSKGLKTISLNQFRWQHVLWSHSPY